MGSSPTVPTTETPDQGRPPGRPAGLAPVSIALARRALVPWSWALGCWGRVEVAGLVPAGLRGGRLLEHDRDQPPTRWWGHALGHTWVARSGHVIEVGVGRSFVPQPRVGVSRFDRARPQQEGSGWVWEVFEHFSGDVAFQDPGDLSHGFAFGESPGDVIAGSLIVSHPGDDHVIERPNPSSLPDIAHCRVCDIARSDG